MMLTLAYVHVFNYCMLCNIIQTQDGDQEWLGVVHTNWITSSTEGSCDGESCPSVNNVCTINNSCAFDHMISHDPC